MKIIYLASFEAQHPRFDVVYQDINGKRDIGGDMMDVDLTPFDVIIATPPCNYYSIANYRRETSEYAQKTKHLLPSIIHKLLFIGKPFIVENVRNALLFRKAGLLSLPLFVYVYGRHTYWTNIPFNVSNMIFPSTNINQSSTRQRQGSGKVHEVIDYWLEVVTADYASCYHD